MQLRNLYLLLETVAEKHPGNGLLIYSPGMVDAVGTTLTYPDLLSRAQLNANLIHKLDAGPGSIVLLHFNNHLDNLVWFWSVVCAGLIPALSTPFTNNAEQRKKHIAHLRQVLDDPICLTSKGLLSEFAKQDALRLRTIDSLTLGAESLNGYLQKDRLYFPVVQGQFKRADDLAVLMLTSGSTGNAKAVSLTHGQMLDSIAGKCDAHNTKESPFLNWVGVDHVACLTEIHLHAMWAGASQVHVQAADLVPHPLRFLQLIQRHRVAHSFAPNFFLASLRRALESPDATELRNSLDLSTLRTIVTGGEANVVETCVALTKLLNEHGASSNVLSPAFGMTETCGGSIYSKDCPRRDIECNNEFATVGSCISGMDMRITDDSGKDIGRDVAGNLEVRGPVVFSKYYNNPKATSDSFHDGWFITGDRGIIDSLGQLTLTGRAKETVIINGVNYFPYEIETTLDDIPGAKPSYTLVFPHRRPGAQTETLCVVYLPTYAADDVLARVETSDAISKAIMLQTGVRPDVIPLDEVILQKSTLGKLPRAKIRSAFENGSFRAFQNSNGEIIASHKAASYEPPANEVEELISSVYEDVFDVPKQELGVKTNIFVMGVNSIDIIRVKQVLDKKLQLDVPIIMVMTNPSIRSLANALEDLRKPHVYNPMVVLQSQGSKTPLWLIHPGMGEVLVFLALASHFTDRPVYAIRARGFEEGELPFSSISEVVTTYHAKIKATQPTGPYAIAGYSYGSMIAFEITKLLNRNADEVKFLGILNLPPHIAFRMRQLD